MFKNRQFTVIEGKCRRFRNSSECSNTHLCCKWLTNLDAKGAKRSVKMWNKHFYKSFFNQKWFVVHKRSAVKNSFITRVCYALDGLFWLKSVCKKVRPNFRVFLFSTIHIEDLNQLSNSTVYDLIWLWVIL